jgi:hypothetical protein
MSREPGLAGHLIGRFGRRPLLALLLLLPLAMLWLARSDGPAQAVRRLQSAAVEAYPHIEGSPLESCELCHAADSDDLNPYGRDFERRNRDFRATEDLDSDGDGFSNLVEIEALSFPGDPDDKPSPARIYLPIGEG